jgi:hypothetical protein
MNMIKLQKKEIFHSYVSLPEGTLLEQAFRSIFL